MPAVRPRHRSDAHDPGAVGLKSPAVVNGVKQKPIEGLSLYYTFNNPPGQARLRRRDEKAPGHAVAAKE
ncbi:MAG: hypothetical protein ACOZF2_03005 [Thermodesulfobacteriota bacterium]